MVGSSLISSTHTLLVSICCCTNRELTCLMRHLLKCYPLPFLFLHRVWSKQTSNSQPNRSCRALIFLHPPPSKSQSSLTISSSRESAQYAHDALQDSDLPSAFLLYTDNRIAHKREKSTTGSNLVDQSLSVALRQNISQLSSTLFVLLSFIRRLVKTLFRFFIVACISDKSSHVEFLVPDLMSTEEKRGGELDWNKQICWRERTGYSVPEHF